MRLGAATPGYMSGSAACRGRCRRAGAVWPMRRWQGHSEPRPAGKPGSFPSAAAVPLPPGPGHGGGDLSPLSRRFGAAFFTSPCSVPQDRRAWGHKPRDRKLSPDLRFVSRQHHGPVHRLALAEFTHDAEMTLFPSVAPQGTGPSPRYAPRVTPRPLCFPRPCPVSPQTQGLQSECVTFSRKKSLQRHHQKDEENQETPRVSAR